MKHEVAPPTGAWIEMKLTAVKMSTSKVAPPTGAWIEIVVSSGGAGVGVSLPPRERGLKYVLDDCIQTDM